MDKRTPQQIEDSLRNRSVLQRELRAQIIAGLAGIAGLSQAAKRSWEEWRDADRLAADLSILVQLCLGLAEPELRYREVLSDISALLYEQQQAARKDEAVNG